VGGFEQGEHRLAAALAGFEAGGALHGLAAGAFELGEVFLEGLGLGEATGELLQAGLLGGDLGLQLLDRLASLGEFFLGGNLGRLQAADALGLDQPLGLGEAGAQRPGAGSISMKAGVSPAPSRGSGRAAACPAAPGRPAPGRP
jgi:hypothetical protein